MGSSGTGSTHSLGGAPARFPGGLREVAPRTWLGEELARG